MIKEIRNIRPFNSLFYRSCYFNSFLPIIEMMGKNTEAYLLNDVPKYQLLSESNNKLYVGINYINNLPFEMLLQQTGVQLDKFQVSQESFKEILIECLDNDRPVILWIDYFYSPIRLDQFGKKHGPHTVLVYGYDLTEEVFIILEHEQKMILDYKRKKIRFEDLSNCYFGYVERFSHLNDDSCLEVFSKKESIIVTKDEMADRLKRNYECYTQDFIEGIKGIETLAEYLAMNIFNEKFFFEYVELQQEGLNQIVNAKKAQVHLFSNLFQRHTPQVEICDHWIRVRTILFKSMYSGKFSENVMVECIERLEDIIELEKIQLQAW